MKMKKHYDKETMKMAHMIFHVMERRVSAEDMRRIKEAFDFACMAHEGQKRKSGAPFIVHPVAVAKIVAEELGLGANPVIAAFLHDVVEDTDYTIDDIRQRFGDDVAFLVSVVTKNSNGHCWTYKSLYHFPREFWNNGIGQLRVDAETIANSLNRCHACILSKQQGGYGHYDDGDERTWHTTA